MELPNFLALPTLRCFGELTGAAPCLCGAPASRYRHGGTWGLHVFLCAEHAEPTDVPIPASVVFRRVRIMGCLDVAAVSWTPARAQNEAVAAMEAAVRAGGGLLSVMGVTSATGRYSAPDGPKNANGDTGGV